MMNLRRIGMPLLVALLVLVPASGQAWEFKINDTFQPEFQKKKTSYYRAFKFDGMGGLKFKIKKQKIEGEKQPGIRFTSSQDGGYGFFNTGLRLNLDYKINATYSFPKDKGLVDGATFAGLEVDYPYVPLGTMPTKFFFVGVTWHQDGLSTFVNDSGSTVGTQASYPGARTVDIEFTHSAGAEFSIKTRPFGALSWDTLYTGDPDAMLSYPAGAGFGLAYANRGGTVFLSGLRIGGNIFGNVRQSYLDDIQQAIDLETQALDEPDLTEKFNKLQQAASILDEAAEDLDWDYEDGFIDCDIDAVLKQIDKAIKLDGKASNKLDPLTNPLQSWGDKQRKQVEKAIKRKRAAAEMIQVADIEGPFPVR